MQVELRQQLFLDAYFGVVGAKQEAVGQNHRRPASLLQPVHDDRHKEIRRLAAGQVCGEVIFHVCFLTTPIGRIHQHHIKLVVLGVVQHIMKQAVVVVNVRHIYVVQQQVGDAEHIGNCFFSTP